MISIAKAAKAATALVVTALFPLAAVAPAAAVSLADYSSFEFNCLTDFGGDASFEYPLFEDTVTVTLVGCTDASMSDLADSTNAELHGGVLDSIVFSDIDVDPDTLVISGPVEISVKSGGNEIGTMTFAVPDTLPAPSGVPLDTLSVEIPLDAPDFSVGDPTEIDNATEIEIAPECWLTAGPHVYGTGPLTIGKSGSFTLRQVSASRFGEWVEPTEDFFPTDDSVFIIYSSFDPEDPTANIVGCGDETIVSEIDPSLDDWGWYFLNDGRPQFAGWPYFTTDLAADSYTVVYTTYEEFSTSEFANGDDGISIWDPSPVTLDIELWGTEGTAALSDSLASTGVDPSFGLWTGLALAGTGVAITVARRRAQRA